MDHISCFKQLLPKDNNKNKDKDISSKLKLPTLNGHGPILIATKFDALRVIHLLANVACTNIDLDIDPNEFPDGDESGITMSKHNALMVACKKGSDKIVEALMRFNNLNINARSMDHYTTTYVHNHEHKYDVDQDDIDEEKIIKVWCIHIHIIRKQYIVEINLRWILQLKMIILNVSDNY